ncbi:MAG: hypothetical protein HZA50_10475 [Planctomycetes bacterium]|nr:hypothetical protein [Planctomycetota bacterium]
MHETMMAAVVFSAIGITICMATAEETATKPASGKGNGIEFVWWEGESPAGASDNLNDRHTFDSSHANLSGGKSFGGTSKAGTWVEYEVTVPRDDKWFFYIRKFWTHGPFRYQWNGAGDWVTIDWKHTSRLDHVQLNEHCVNWLTGGQVELKRGKNRLRIEAIETGADKYGPFVFDCFILTDKPFRPNGTLKPGQKHNRAPEGWFPFEPDCDTFAPAVLDLRVLNEPEAGSQGRIIAKGDDLVFEKTGKKVRFWGATAGPDIWRDKASMDLLARRLAKVGVNMVRFHIADMQEETPGPGTAGIHYFFTALKKQGIYSDFLWYCTAGGMGCCVWYFDPKSQERWKTWAKCLLGTVNPHTGIPLAKDPAVASIELLDEDGLFFWTFTPNRRIPAEATAILEKLFGDWLKTRYGSLEKAAAAWGAGKYPKGDDFAQGRVGLYDAGMLTSQDWAVAQRNELRAHDQAEFLTQLARNWYVGMKKWLSDELGYKGLVIGSNWQTADSRVLGPLDQYTYMGVDLTARNTYFGTPGKGGKRLGYAVSKDDYYTDVSVLRQPEQAMLMHIQCAGYPHFLTEGAWNMPNRFRTEEPFLMSCYGSLQGMDGYFPFVLKPTDWLVNNITTKWPIQTPVTLGQYPAAAVIFRNGYVKEGPVAINEALALKDLYALKGGALSQAMGQDMAHDKEIPDGAKAEVNSLSGLDPLAFFVGRVVRTIGENPGKSSVLSNLGKLIDRNNKTVKSATGELTLDYGKGLATLNAPCAQGAAGFLQAAGPIKLADVTIELKNEYGAVMVVSLDGKPINESAKILVQVMTEEKNYGWETQATKTEFEKGKGEVECLQITSLGESPICVRKFAGTISLNRPDVASIRVTPLDCQGYPDPEKKVESAKEFKLLDTTMYYILGDASAMK